MPDAKTLTPAAWKAVSAKCKVQNKDLMDVLTQYDKIDEDDHDELLDTITEIKQTALQLKKSKDAAGNKDLLKYLGDLVSAAEAEQRDVTKDKAEAEKAEKKDAKKAQDEDEENEDTDDEEEEGAYQDKLVAALKKLKGAKGTTYQFIVCDGKPPAVMIAKKIGPKHKDELSKVTGSKRFLHVGECSFDGSHYNFDMEKPVSGLAKKLQESLKHHTGKRQPVTVGNESADADDEDTVSATSAAANTAASTAAKQGKASSAAAADTGSDTGNDADARDGDETNETEDAETPVAKGAAAVGQKVGMTQPLDIKGSVGKGGKNQPDDVKAIQAALNKKIKANLPVDGKCGPAVIAAIVKLQQQMGLLKPDGRIDPGRGTLRALAAPGALPPPPPPPKPVAAPKLGKAELAKAPGIWEGMRQIIDKNIEELKKAVQAHYAHEQPGLIADIVKNLGKLDGITDKLDLRVAESLKKAQAAANDAARQAELKKAKTILTEYIGYVKSEPLIAHVDANPWVKIDLKKTVIDHITHMAQAIGK